MKIVKRFKGWKIKETNEKDKADGLTYNYYIYSPEDEDYAEWECDTIEECLEWIKNY